MNFNNQDLFKEMNAMMDRLMAGMEENSSFFEPQVTGYRIIIDGVPISPRGNTTGPVPAENANEQVPEILRVGNDVYVIADIPGVSEDNLNLTLNGNRLAIDASGSTQVHHMDADLPDVDPASMKHTLKNGVLEVTFTALPGTAHESKPGESQPPA
jgi:HSP20 family protein